jgi:eukaryotic-like serine/threonine-protein kinase
VHPVLALDVAAQAAAGLGAAHRIGLVHRDVKPGNILVGADGLVKITDFGIAHAAGSAPITGPGLVMGTTQYMAPERIAGGQATPASDLYALGILIYECLTGLPPYDGGTAEVMAGHLYLPMPPLPAGVPPELDELITRLTAKDPAARMSDAAEVAAIATRLRDALAADAGRTVAAHSPAGRPSRTGRRRATTLAAGVTVLAGAGVAWLLASGALHDSPAADHLTVSPPATTAPGGSPSSAPPATRPAASHPASARPGGSVTAGASRQATHSPGTSPGSSPASSASPSQSSSASHSPGPAPTSTSPAPWPTLPLPLISLGL